MLNKHNLAVHQFVTKEAGRYATNVIHVTPKETVATDGTVLVRVSTPKLDPANFPLVDGVKPSATFKPFNLSVDAARTIEKAIPKKSTIPILSNVMIDGKATDAHPDKDLPDCAVLAVSDLENPQVFHPKKDGGNFPNWQAVIPKREEAKFAICLDARLLAKLAQFAAKFAANDRVHEVRIRFYGEDKPVRLDAQGEDGQEWTGVLMPLRGPDDWKGAKY